VLAAAAHWRFRHPTRQRPRLFALGLILSDSSQLLQALLEPLVRDQAAPGGVGRHGGAIQGATLAVVKSSATPDVRDAH